MIIMFAHVPQTDWFQYLEEPAQRLVTVALVLAEEEQAETTSLADYTFVVFPMAKAYEGFLKQYFRDIGLISQEVYLIGGFGLGERSTQMCTIIIAMMIGSTMMWRSSARPNWLAYCGILG